MAKSKATQKVVIETPTPTPYALEMFRRKQRRNGVNHDDEITWVYLNIDNPGAECEKCPSLGAWTMLAHARENRGWFYEKLYKPMAERLAKARQVEQAVEYMPSKVEKLACAEIEAMIKEAREAIGL